MLYMLYGVDGPDGPAARDRARPAHFAYLEAHKDILVLGGATLADGDDARTGSAHARSLSNATPTNTSVKSV